MGPQEAEPETRCIPILSTMGEQTPLLGSSRLGEKEQRDVLEAETKRAHSRQRLSRNLARLSILSGVLCLLLALKVAIVNHNFSFALFSPPTWQETETTHASNASHIPDYVFEYAPLVHLFSGEEFWPCDMQEHLNHMTPEINYEPITSQQQLLLNLSNLRLLNHYGKGRHVFLTSNDNVEDRPDWLGGEKNIPSPFPHPQESQHSRIKRSQPSPTHPKPQGGRSDAPAVLITVNKGNGIVDAFWFFFYSYNLGNVVLNIRFGNHVGDWEHTMVRFQHGKPVAVYFSEHNFGSAYSYEAVEKIGKRPIIYSAVGTHAMYSTPGLHPYILPLGLLHDETDRGPLWDPALNYLSYTFNHHTGIIRPSALNPAAPVSWFYFNGHWGDKFYPLSDGSHNQYEFFGEYHYVNGPLGPKFKNLGRREVCEGGTCVVKDVIGGVGDVRVGKGVGTGEEWPDELPPGLGEGRRGPDAR